MIRPPDGVENFGWPCYEGNGRHPSYDTSDLNLCEGLYTAGVASVPFFAYNHNSKVFSEESCPTGSSSIAGPGVHTAEQHAPAEFDGALFFSDYSRKLHLGDGAHERARCPIHARIRTFRAGACGPVDLEFGPGNDLYYVDHSGGTIRRIHYIAGNQPPRAGGQREPDERRHRRCRSTSRRRLDRSRIPATRSPTPGTSTATASMTTPPRRPRSTPIRARAATWSA